MVAYNGELPNKQKGDKKYLKNSEMILTWDTCRLIPQAAGIAARQGISL